MSQEAVLRKLRPRISNNSRIYQSMFKAIDILVLLIMDSRVTGRENNQTFTTLSNVDESKAIEILLKKRAKHKKSQSTDPVYSQLFVICEESAQKLARRHNAKSQRRNKSDTRSQVTQKKKMAQIKNNRRSFTSAYSAELPSISNRFYSSEARRAQSKSVKVNESHARNIIAKFTNQEIGAQQHIMSNRKFYTVQSETNESNETNMGNKKAALVRKTHTRKMESKQKKSTKILSQWQQIDILKLETYFMKLKRAKKHSLLSQTRIGNDKSGHTNKNVVPEQQKISDFIKNYTPINPQIDINKLIQHERFGVLFDNGLSLYFGQLINGIKCGLGVYVCHQFKFEGFWKGNEKIVGFEITPNGYYKGKFKSNKRHGEGQYIWENGESYSGEWREGVKCGSGSWKSGKGDCYIGQWLNGKVEGYGVHITATGQRYEGQFKQFLKHNQGKQTFPNGDIYDGSYLCGHPQGQGKYLWKNGTCFEGHFSNGYRDGKGVLMAKNYLRFEGIFKKDLPNGQGVLEIGKQSRYLGMFKDGEKHGQGTLSLFNESKIMTGTWSNNNFLFEIPE